eukprot:477559_1
MKQKLENQLLIKFPDELCDQISSGIDSGKLPMITLRPVTKTNNNTNTNNSKHDTKSDTEYEREFELQISGDNNTYSTKLMDLPCIIESQKTYNKNLYFKTGDISQMLIVSNNNNNESNTNTNNNNIENHSYILDSGITPPSRDIRERWSHVRPICHHDNIEINDYCHKCHNIPRGLINKVSKEIHNRMHGQSSETWDLITKEEWIEVTDDSDNDDDDAQMDRKLKNSQTINDNEWEQESDDDINNNNNINNNIVSKNMNVNINNNMKKERVFNRDNNNNNNSLRRDINKNNNNNSRNNSMKRTQ